MKKRNIDIYIYILISALSMISILGFIIGLLSGSRYMELLFFMLQFFVSIFLLNVTIKKYVSLNKSSSSKSDDSQIMLYDYDLYKRKLTVRGNSMLIFGKTHVVLSDSKLSNINSLFHEDDVGIIDDIKNIINGASEEINTEIRILCKDKVYRWFRICGTLIKSDSGNALGVVGSILNVEDKHRQEKIRKDSSERDSLTGVYNKSTFAGLVKDELENNEPGSVSALFVVDLDRFKRINDELGHVVGDKVLEDVSHKLCAIFNDKDIVGRTGGDEFAVFIRVPSDFCNMANKLVNYKAASIFEKVKDTYCDEEKEILVTASVGVAISGNRSETYIDLYRRANTNLISENEFVKE